MGQQQFNFTAIRTDDAKSPATLMGAVNRQFNRLASVLHGPQQLDLGELATDRTVNPATVDITSITLAGDVTLTLELTKTRAGSEGRIELTQDATGGRVVAWANALTTPTIAPGAGARTLLLAVRVADGWVLTTLASGY